MDKVQVKAPKINYYENTKTAIGKGVGHTINHLNLHWIDYLLVVFILFILGAFDIFILKQSDKFLTGEYWYHVACRVLAYVLAAILGFRIGYPKAKDACEELKTALEKNSRLLVYKEQNGEIFDDYIAEINLTIKAEAWKKKINGKITRLAWFKPNFFLLYYKTRSTEYFSRYSLKKQAVLMRKAEQYREKRSALEKLLEPDYVNENIRFLSVNFPKVSPNDFGNIETIDRGYKTFKTRANVKGNASKMIGTVILSVLLFSLLLGSVKMSIDEALVEARLVTWMSVIVNSVLDVGLTLWRFSSAQLECPRIVRQEDLRCATDQNELLVRFKRDKLSPEQIASAEQEIEKIRAEKLRLETELLNA